MPHESGVDAHRAKRGDPETGSDTMTTTALFVDRIVVFVRT
ncbi:MULTISPECIES: hypothetical protein [Brevibacterium]|nr:MULTISPECIES: hypothetical protein [Brevibacterium]